MGENVERADAIREDAVAEVEILQAISELSDNIASQPIKTLLTTLRAIKNITTCDEVKLQMVACST